MEGRTLYFQARRATDGSFEIEGEASADLGRQIPSTIHDRPDGVWASWRWDGSALTVETDRYGFLPLFYWADEDRVAVSPSLFELVRRGAPRDIDATALGTFLHLGFYLADTTPFKAIRVAPPNGGITWDGTLTVRDGTPIRPVADITYEAMVDRYIDLFRAAMDRRLPDDERFAVPVSGGRDSRHILLELAARDMLPAFAITSHVLPPRRDVEVEPAAALCAALGAKHVVVRPPTHFVCEYRQMMDQHLCADENGWIMGVADHLRARGVRTSYDGVAGDMYFAARPFKEQWIGQLKAGRAEEIAETILERDVSTMTSYLGDAYAGVDDRDAARAALAAELDRYRETSNPLSEFRLFNRTRREVGQAAYGIMSDFVVHAPFLDHELNDFSASVPHEVMFGQGTTHDEVIARAYPAYRDVPYSDKSGRPQSATMTYVRFTSRAIAYAARHHPSWLGCLPRLAAQWTRCAASKSYRQRYRWMTPARLLYLVLVDQLRTDPHAFASPICRRPPFREWSAADG
jgi:hypothetical protein